jgi:hypothetical protein
MKKGEFLLQLIFFVFVSFLLHGCASVPDKDFQANARFFDRPYDEVWEALEDLIFNDLGVVPSKSDRKRGIIETDWVHRIDIEGKLRWMIRAEIKKENDGVWVFIDKIVEKHEKVKPKRQVHPLEPRQKLIDVPSEWQKQAIDPDVIEDLYQRIENKFSNL